MNRQDLRRLVEIGFAVALVAVLSNIRVYKLPQGGSITAGSLVPIFYIALRWGGKAGPPRERFITVQDNDMPKPAKTKSRSSFTPCRCSWTTQ